MKLRDASHDVRDDVPPWLICEPAQRWRAAVLRFCPELAPAGLTPAIESGDWQATLRGLSARRGRPAIVLWDSHAPSVLELCDWLLQGWHANRAALPIVAANRRSRRERAVLLELPCAAVIRHVEDLPRLRPMITGYLGGAGLSRIR